MHKVAIDRSVLGNIMYLTKRHFFLLKKETNQKILVRLNKSRIKGAQDPIDSWLVRIFSHMFAHIFNNVCKFRKWKHIFKYVIDWKLWHRQILYEVITEWHSVYIYIFIWKYFQTIFFFVEEITKIELALKKSSAKRKTENKKQSSVRKKKSTRTHIRQWRRWRRRRRQRLVNKNIEEEKEKDRSVKIWCVLISHSSGQTHSVLSYAEQQQWHSGNSSHNSGLKNVRLLELDRMNSVGTWINLVLRCDACLMHRYT